MYINFYLNNEEETPIMDFSDFISNPFAVGDIITCNVEELYPVQYNQMHHETQLKFLTQNKELREAFHRKKIKIVREGKYTRFSNMGEPKLTIEYHCDLLTQ